MSFLSTKKIEDFQNIDFPKVGDLAKIISQQGCFYLLIFLRLQGRMGTMLFFGSCIGRSQLQTIFRKEKFVCLCTAMEE